MYLRVPRPPHGPHGCDAKDPPASYTARWEAYVPNNGSKGMQTVESDAIAMAKDASRSYMTRLDSLSEMHGGLTRRQNAII
jgi:hypothetical protein